MITASPSVALDIGHPRLSLIQGITLKRNSPMAKHLVLVGGGHAHMMTLANINAFVAKGHRVTVIGPSEHHYYSGMGPGMLGGT